MSILAGNIPRLSGRPTLNPWSDAICVNNDVLAMKKTSKCTCRLEKDTRNETQPIVSQYMGWLSIECQSTAG